MDKIKKTRIGRPPVSAKNKATKPNVTVPNDIQEQAKLAAERMGIGYSEFVTRALLSEITRQETIAETERKRSGFSTSLSPLKQRNA